MSIRGSKVPVTKNSRKRALSIALGIGLLVLFLASLPAIAAPVAISGTARHIASGGEATPPRVKLTPTNSLVCDGDAGLNVEFSDVPDLYGYQFKINYDATLAEAGGAFANGWFDAGNGIVPPGWDAQCAGGECRFAASLLNPATPISGGGAVATITFTPLAVGTFDVILSDVILSDIDGFPIAVEVDATPLTFTVCGQAAVSGVVSLQGRLTSLDGGWITLSDAGGGFPDIHATFDDSGVYSVSDIPVLPDGSTYTIRATHDLYLGNEKALPLNPGDSLTNQDTRLLGGDANNSGLNPPYTEGVDIGDVACIANWFRLGAGSCGAFTGAGTDINKDALTNIQDLAIVAGNYLKDPFQPW
jgi:hypothetical protein